MKLLQKADADEAGAVDGCLVDKTSTGNKGHELTAAVKTNTSSFPKKDIEKKMQEWPSGSCLVMESTASVTGVKLVAIGHRHNSRKTLCFIMTKDAGSTLPGAPHKARFPDQCGNVVERKVTRPDALSFCFSTSDLIDAHNHARQFLLGLEWHWKTPNPWFGNVTTVVGMTVINCWKALKFRLPQLCGNISVEEFADRLAHDCHNNGFQKNSAGTARGDIAADGITANRSLPSALSRPMESLNEGFQNMSVHCCGLSATSPLTVDSGSVFF